MLGAFLDLGMGLANNMFAEERQDDAQQFSADQSEITRVYNAEQAAKQRQWEHDMSATRYQRAVEDMKKAGLNPMLAYHQGGASNSSGAAASASAGGAGIASPAQSHSIQAGMQSASQIEVNKALEERTKAEAEKVRAEEQEIRARTPTHAVSIQQMEQNIRESQERIHKIIQETATSAFSAANLDQQTQNLRALVPQILATVDQLRAQTKLVGAQEGQTRTLTGLTAAQTDEVRQRIKQNLPQIERAIKDLEEKARYLEMPRRGMDAATHSSYIGALSAVLRALNPFANLSGSIR